jgi:hypothetical protein
MADTDQWEYRAETVGSFWNGIKAEDLNALLNEWGEQGWEVVSLSFSHSSSRPLVVAKRPLTASTRRQRSLPGNY